jgi:hypothetical protein
MRRDTVSEAIVTAIALAQTFLAYFGSAPKPHMLEGFSALLLGHGKGAQWSRRFVVSEYDYAMQTVRRALGRGSARLPSLHGLLSAGEIYPYDSLPANTVDLERDLSECVDRGGDPRAAPESARLRALLLD